MHLFHCLFVHKNKAEVETWLSHSTLFCFKLSWVVCIYLTYQVSILLLSFLHTSSCLDIPVYFSAAVQTYGIKNNFAWRHNYPCDEHSLSVYYTAEYIQWSLANRLSRIKNPNNATSSKLECIFKNFIWLAETQWPINV